MMGRMYITHRTGITWKKGDELAKLPGEITILVDEVIGHTPDSGGVTKTEITYVLDYNHLMDTIGDCE